MECLVIVLYLMFMERYFLGGGSSCLRPSLQILSSTAKIVRSSRERVKLPVHESEEVALISQVKIIRKTSVH